MDEALQKRLQEAGIAAPLQELLARTGESIVGLQVPADDALDLWEQLRDLVPTTGHWPVILAADLPRLREDYELDPRPVAEILRAADGVGPDPRLWIESDFEDAEEMLAELGGWHGTWPSEVQPVVDLELEVQEDQLRIALVPTARGSEAAAHLRFGGQSWPLPEHHVALLRAWEEAFGAQVVALGGEELALKVTQPPHGDEAAMLLAKAQALYAGSTCGFDSLEELAAHRKVDEVWQFAWAPTGDEE